MLSGDRDRAIATIRGLREGQSRTGESEAPQVQPTSQQLFAIDLVANASGFAPHLLFGVTGSGKTEVYLRAIARTLELNAAAQALLLVPEINLTPQLESLLRARFPGEQVVALHSNLADAERAAAWLAAHEGRARIVVGTRLAVFCSLPRLSIIVSDEEHIRRQSLEGCSQRVISRSSRGSCWRFQCVLGSATPSMKGRRHTWAPFDCCSSFASAWAGGLSSGRRRADRRSNISAAERIVGADCAGSDRQLRSRRAVAGVSEPARLCARRDVRSVRLAIELPSLLHLCGLSQTGSDPALPSLRIRGAGATCLPDVRQPTAERSRPGHAAHRRNIASAAAAGQDSAHRPRLDAPAARGH